MKREPWHRGAEEGDYEYVDEGGDVAATIWRTAIRWAWSAYPNAHDTRSGVAETLREAKSAAIAALG